MVGKESTECSAEAQVFPFTEELVELGLFLPGWQAAALEQAAHDRGLTTGQMVRDLIEQHFARFAQTRSCRQVV